MTEISESYRKVPYDLREAKQVEGRMIMTHFSCYPLPVSQSPITNTQAWAQSISSNLFYFINISVLNTC